MNFTAHNILLDNGQQTIPDQKILLADSGMWKSIQKTLHLFSIKSHNDERALKVVDLGCLEGGYSVEFAKMGFDTLGIEAREQNIKKCQYVYSNLQLSNLKFIKDDVRNVQQYGPFDITFCYGLLYHLDKPVDFLEKLSARTSKILFLNTHYTSKFDFWYNFRRINSRLLAPIQKKYPSYDFKKNYALSPPDKNEGYEGRWYREWADNESQPEIEKMLWSSYNNSKSFWLYKKDLIHALHKVGFTSVFEQFDFTGDPVREDYNEYYSRGMFVAIKH